MLYDLIARICATSYILLTRFAQTYLDQAMNIGIIPVPGHIPVNLLVFEKRRTVDLDHWSDAAAIWIRTWYDDQARSTYHPVEELATRSDVDEACTRF